MSVKDQWRADQLLAWTERDGPGRPPHAPGRASYLALAVGLGAILYGVSASDTLCPEHRLWVQHIGVGALAVGVGAIVALARRRAVGTLLALVTAAAGVVIGAIDTIHSPTRGHLVAAGFAILATGTCVLLLAERRLGRFDRAVLAAAAPMPAEALSALAANGEPECQPVTEPLVRPEHLQ